jgi:prevent-host-death family protein
MTWQLQQAKNQLSEVVGRALSDGPQTITRHGKPAVVVVAYEDYQSQTNRGKLSTILRDCPVKGWSIKRDKRIGRKVSVGL